MEERAQIPPGLPVERPSISYWQDPPSSIATHRDTRDLPSDIVDHVIIGSGISGASIAFNLLSQHPNATVLMLEAREACSGATGRNGGHTKGASYRHFLHHERTFGTFEAIKITRLEHANILATHQFARDHGISCASMECETVDVVFSGAEMEAGTKAIARMRETMGADDPACQYQIWSAEQARAEFPCPDAVGAFTYPAGSLSAYDFTIGVLDLALRKGLNLQTSTPAQSAHLRKINGSQVWMVKTLRGAVTARNLIVATNGYSAHLLPQLQGLIVPLHGQVVAQRPGSALPQAGFSRTYSFIQANGYEYMITRPRGFAGEGDIIIGGGIWTCADGGVSRFGNADDETLDPGIRAYLRACTQAYFSSHNWGEDHPLGRVKREWSGIMGATPDGLPFVGGLPGMQGLWVSAGFNGHGMVWCWKSAEALVGMIGGRESEVSAWFPAAARVGEERMKAVFKGRTDLKYGETKEEKGRL